MDQVLMNYALLKLGFISEMKLKRSKSANSKSCLSEMCSEFNLNFYQNLEKQKFKVMNLWVILGGEYFGHVTLNNLRMMLLAIKGLHVQPDVPLCEESVKFEGPLGSPLGIFGPSGDMYLFGCDIERAI